MTHYAKMGAVVMRSFGLMILLYATPVLIWGIIRMAIGVSIASDGRPPIGAAFFAWFFYGVAGLLLFALAKPLGRLAAHGFGEAESSPPAV